MTESKQPRFFENTEDFFISTARFADDTFETEPLYTKDSRKRDKWLSEFYPREPHLAGVVNSVTAIDKNRGWRVIGGRNQVRRITQTLHNFQVAPGLKGWRPGLASASEAFWTTDMGSVIELGKDFKDGPITALFNVDPTKCQLTGNSDYPLKYYPGREKMQKWRTQDFFRVVSSPALQEEFNGLGRCAVSRAVQLAQLMVALFRHEEEMLLSRAPRGLLTISGIKRDQWNAAMEAREAEMDNNNIKYFGAVAVLASASSTVEAKLVALSQLPQNFDMKIWMDMLLYGYALCFGYDASEFWPVQYGALGRGNETQIQHEKATGKGRLDFVLGFQEQLDDFLPDSIDFEFDQRDEQGDLIHASVHRAWAEVYEILYRKTELISYDEGRILLAKAGLIDPKWTKSKSIESTDSVEVSPSDDSSNDGQGFEPPEGDDGEGTNKVAASPTANVRPTFNIPALDLLKEELKEKDFLKRATEKYPNDEIVLYSFPENSYVTLWDEGLDVFRRKTFPVPPPLPFR